MPSPILGSLTPVIDQSSHHGFQEPAPRGLGARLAARRWPVAVTIFMLAGGALFMFGWDPLVKHTHAWFVGGDLWGIFRAAHYVGWGFVGGVYAPGNGVVS